MESGPVVDCLPTNNGDVFCGVPYSTYSYVKFVEGKQVCTEKWWRSVQVEGGWPKPWDVYILVGGLEHVFFHILGIIIPSDFHIFQRGRSTTKQHIIIYHSYCTMFFSWIPTSVPHNLLTTNVLGWTLVCPKQGYSRYSVKPYTPKPLLSIMVSIDWYWNYYIILDYIQVLRYMPYFHSTSGKTVPQTCSIFPGEIHIQTCLMRQISMFVGYCWIITSCSTIWVCVCVSEIGLLAAIPSNGHSTREHRGKMMTNNFQTNLRDAGERPILPGFSGQSCGRLCAPDAGLTTSKPKGNTPGELDG